MRSNLLSAMQKAMPGQDKKWYGYFTTVEILELLNLGVQHGGYPIKADLEEEKGQGRSVSRWFYFTPNKACSELLGKKKPRHDTGNKSCCQS